MPSIKYNPDNTEGAYPESIDFLDTEIKKGDRIVATDLVDLYDVDINFPQDGETLYYDEPTELWRNGEGGGSSCNIFEGYDGTVDASHEFESIAAGVEHSLGIKSDGTLWAVGRNDSGELGLGDNAHRDEYVQVGTGTDWAYVSCGKYYSCALKTNGTLWSTGDNSDGQIGNDDYEVNVNVFTQETEGYTDWTYISCGYSHTVALRSDNSVWGCGSNGSGRLGFPDDEDHISYFQKLIWDSNNYILVECGSSHTHVIREGGTLWGTGSNYDGQLGVGDNSAKWGFVQVGSDTDWIYVNGGYIHTMAIKSNGTLYSTGDNYSGQLGLGDNGVGTDRNVFTQVGTGTDWTYVSCGGSHSAAIKDDGILWGTGFNYFGQLGLNDGVDRNTFTQTGTDNDWNNFMCGSHTLFAIKNNSSLWSTGRNNYGQLGLGDSTSRYVLTSVTYLKSVSNYVFIEEDPAIPGNGQQTTPFRSLKDAFIFLRNTCTVIPEDITITIFLLSDVTNTVETSLNHPYGHRIVIDGNDQIITNDYDISIDGAEKDILFDGASVCVGYRTTLVIKDNDTLWLTGNNQYGQLGTGDGVRIYEFEQLGTDFWEKVDGGTYYTTGLKKDGTIWSCGHNISGPLGVGDNVHKTVFVQEFRKDSDWIYIGCGGNHSFGIKNDGTLWGTGYNGWGQLGTNEGGGGADKNVFTQEVGFDTDWIQVAGGDSYTMALKSNGTIWGTGYGGQGQMGNNLSSVKIFTQEANLDTDWVFVDCNYACTFAIKEDGTLWACGSGTYYQLGSNSTSNQQTFTQEYRGDTDWKQVAAGWVHTLAVKTDGTLWSCGWTTSGALCQGSTTIVKIFTQIGTENDWAYVACGGYHSVAIKKDGSVYTSGEAVYGQLGWSGVSTNVLTSKAYEKYVINTVVGSDPKVQLRDNNSLSTQNINLDFDITDDGVTYDDRGEFIDTSAGNQYSLAVKKDGTLWATGYNNLGQLGLGDKTSRNVFTQVGTDTNWIQVSCGYRHTIAQKSNGTLWGCGENSTGELGLGYSGSGTEKTSFVQIGTDTDWNTFNAGYSNTLVVKIDGTLWGTGNNSRGQLGLNDKTNRNVLTKVGTDTNWLMTSGGAYDTMALKTNGTILGCGANARGILGISDGLERIVFTQESGADTDWVTLDCGYYHTVAVKTDGTMWSTGWNNSGELGLGDYTQRETFTKAGTNTNWLSVSCGDYFTIARKINNTAFGAGSNSNGQLGIDDFLGKNVFTQVVSSDYWQKISCGVDHSLSIKSFGSLWATGGDSKGQLGILGSSGSKEVFTYVDGGIFIDGTLITDFIYENVYDNLIHTQVINNSSIGISNYELLNTEDHFIIKEIIAGTQYVLVYISKIPLYFFKSVGTFNESIPENIILNVKSTANIPDLQDDIINWSLKNNSLSVIYDESSHNIDINNENSTLIINDAIN